MAVKNNNNRPDRGANRKAGNVKLTAEEENIALAKELRLKPKTKQLYDEVINNPKTTQREAYMKVHKTNNVASADATASKLLNSPKYHIYSQRAVGKAKRRVVQLVDSASENISLKAAQDILDRTEGKAVQKTEHSGTVVSVSLDLAGKRIGAHYVKPQPSES